MGKPVNATSKTVIFRWLFRLLAGAFGVFLLILGVIYVFLQRDPDALIAEYLSDFEQKTGLKFEIGAIDVTLLPLPSIALTDTRIYGSGMDFRIAWCSARPGLWRILHGDFTPATVTILRPRLQIATDLPLENPVEAIKLLYGERRDSSANFSLPELALAIEQGEAEIKGKDDSLVALSGFAAEVRLEGKGTVSGTLHLPATRITQAKARLLALENFDIGGATDLFDPLGKSQNLSASGLLRWSGVFRIFDFSGTLDSSASGWNANFAIAADLDLDGGNAPLDLNGKVMQLAGSTEIAARGVTWRLGADSGSLDLVFHLPDSERQAQLNGVLLANRLSLTEWFGFARNLAPGLQIALDNITNCRLEFTLDGQGMRADKIRASCCGSTFTGSGGIKDWKKPLVELDLRTPKASLIRGLPEAGGIEPDAPWYSHQPLTPLPVDPLLPGETPIGYDIRLAADTLLYGPVKFGNARLQIHPGKFDVTGFFDVLLDATASFYGGSVTGHCILGADPSLPYYIKCSAKNINGSPLARDMPILPLRKGIYEASATVTSRGKELARFLAGLKGSIKANGKNATLAEVDASFGEIEAELNLHSAAWDGRRLAFDGKWQAEGKSKEISAICDLNGKILFGAGGMLFNAIPGSFQIALPASPLPKDAKIKLQGKFGANSDAGKYEVSAGTLELMGEKALVNAKIDMKKKPLSVEGNLKSEIKNLRTSLRKFGFNASAVPQELNSLKIESSFTAQGESARLTKIRANIGKIALSGSLGWQKRNKRNFFETDLLADKVLLQGNGDSIPNWDFPVMNIFDAAGKIRIAQAVFWDLRCSNVQIAYRLENGKLAVSSLNANFYGAPVACSATANFRNGLDLEGKLRINAFDIGAAASDRKLKTLFKGSASLDTQIGARLSGKAKLSSKLNGNWVFSIVNGSWQSLNKNGKPDGKPTKFSRIGATGTIVNGVLKSDNFSLNADGLKVGGTGSLNLANQELNCNFNVDMRGWPDFPLRVYGPLSNIKTSIGAGRLALNAIGEVIGGFGNAIGGMLRGAFSIFTR